MREGSRMRSSTISSRISADCGAAMTIDKPLRTWTARRAFSAVSAVSAFSALFAIAVGAQTSSDGNWTTYSGSLSAHRFSTLQQISPSNVARLRPRWVYQPPGTGTLETTPLVVNGVMYVTWGPTAAAALDVHSGKTIWEWTRPIAASVLNLGFPRVNRGVAILDN